MPSNKRKLQSSTPLIAGADNPTLDSNVSFDHNEFSAPEWMQFTTTASPDTLQRFDATNTSKDTPNFANTPQLDLAEGSYNDLSDDSAGSSKRSERRSEPMPNHALPGDTPMPHNDGARQHDIDADMSDFVNFDQCAEEDTTQEIQTRRFFNNFNGVGIFGPMANGFGPASRQQTEDLGTINPQNVNVWESSESTPNVTGNDEAITPQHHRQHSVCSLLRAPSLA